MTSISQLWKGSLLNHMYNVTRYLLHQEPLLNYFLYFNERGRDQRTTELWNMEVLELNLGFPTHRHASLVYYYCTLSLAVQLEILPVAL